MTTAPARRGRPFSAWSRFRGSRGARPSLILVLAALGTGAVTLPYALRWYDVQALTGAVRHPPAATPVVAASLFRTPVPATRAPGDEQGADSTEGGSERWHFHVAFAAVSWFGHDDLGRSLFYRVMPGLLVSVCVGFGAVIVAVIVGTSWGAVAGLCGGRWDSVMMRIVDMLYGLPYLLMVILLKIGLTRPLTTLLGGDARVANLVVLFVAIGGVNWLTMARVVRGQVLSLRSATFVQAARMQGAGRVWILRRHLLPHLAGPVVVYASLVLPQAILQESFLSFLGIGIPPPVPSLGRLAADGLSAVNPFVGYWWLIVVPSAALVFVVLSLNVIGEGLRAAFDPRALAGPQV
jgi:ABC-type dipeptide/oligopeptide/nickel transport system permease subunit